MTLIEVMISLVLLGVVMGVPAMLLRSGSNSYAVESASAEAMDLLRTGIDRISARLETAVAGSLTPPAPATTATLDYSRGVGYGGGGVLFGPVERIEFQYTAADPNDGVDNDGDGLIDEGRVVWIESPGPNQRQVTLVESVAETANGEIPGNGADDNGNGLIDEGGLSFEYDSGRVTIRLSVTRPGPGGTVIARDLERRVSFRN